MLLLKLIKCYVYYVLCYGYILVSMVVKTFPCVRVSTTKIDT